MLYNENVKRLYQILLIGKLSKYILGITSTHSLYQNNRKTT